MLQYTDVFSKDPDVIAQKLMKALIGEYWSADVETVAKVNVQEDKQYRLASKTDVPMILFVICNDTKIIIKLQELHHDDKTHARADAPVLGLWFETIVEMIQRLKENENLI